MTLLNPKATVRHKRLATELRKLREARGYNGGEAASQLGWSSSNLSKAETAARKPSVADVEEMLDLYGCDEALRLALIQLTRNISKRGWWVDYRDVLDPSFFELEDEAVELRSYQTGMVPGLLQTDEYTLALIKLAAGSQETGATDLRRLSARAARRQRLLGPDAPYFHAVIKESVLLCPVGGDHVMQDQLKALLVAAERPNVRLQVLPMKAWQHPGHTGSFMIMGFGGSVNFDVVYVEGAGGSSVYLEDAAQVELSRVNFVRISEAALEDEPSMALIEGLLAK